MNDLSPGAAERARMQQIRSAIDRDVENMVESARSMIDWKHYVKTYPWTCLGAAVALGFLIVPKRSTVVRPELATLTGLAMPGRRLNKPAPTAVRGLVDAILATATNIVIRKATASVGHGVGRLLGMAADPSTPHVTGCPVDRANRSR